MIVDNLGKERRRLGEYLPGKSIKFLPLHIINL